MTNKRIKYEICIGYDQYTQQESAFTKEVLKKISQFAGGCTVVDTNGYWFEDASNKLENFEGKLASEKEFMITASVTLENSKKFYDFLKKEMKVVWSNTEAQVDWIHVEKYETEALHFSLKEE